jgi:hypothetical protein
MPRFLCQGCLLGQLAELEHPHSRRQFRGTTAVQILKVEQTTTTTSILLRYISDRRQDGQYVCPLPLRTHEGPQYSVRDAQEVEDSQLRRSQSLHAGEAIETAALQDCIEETMRGTQFRTKADTLNRIQELVSA